jgi:hypothetical protein
MMSLECPRCHKPFIQRTHRDGISEYLLSWIGVYPFRCQVCTHRFVTLQWGKNSSKERLDRRQYERFPTNLPVTFTTNEQPGEGVAVTLSMDGCSLKTASHLQQGDLLQLQLQLPETPLPVDIEAAIVRSVYPEVIGLQFLRLSLSDQERLGRFMQRLLEEQKA